MKIPKGDQISNYVSQKPVSRTKKRADKAPASPEMRPESQEAAIVDLSQRSMDVQRAQEAVQSAPDVRSERVRAIKERIEKGTYEVKYDETAENMLKIFSREGL